MWSTCSSGTACCREMSHILLRRTKHGRVRPTADKNSRRAAARKFDRMASVHANLKSRSARGVMNRPGRRVLNKSVPAPTSSSVTSPPGAVAAAGRAMACAATHSIAPKINTPTCQRRRAPCDAQSSLQSSVISISRSSSTRRAGTAKGDRNHGHTTARSRRIRGKFLSIAGHADAGVFPECHDGCVNFGLEPGIHRLAFERKDPEYALVHPP